MTDWRAVGWGFAVILVGGLLATPLPGIGHVAVGLAGGFLAGYLADSGVLGGAWHGLLAGAIGGIVVAVLFGAIVGLIATVGLGPLGPLAGGAVALAGIAVAVVLALDSAVAGAVGGLLS